jgi:predicted permease
MPPVPLSLWIEDFGKDVRQAFRSLTANPLFAAVAVLALALGIGANTAIFSVMNAVVLRLLPIHDPARVFNLKCDGQPNGASNTGNSDTSFSVNVFEQLRKNRRAFSDVIAYVPMGFNKIAVRSGNVPEEAAGEMVSGNYFSGLGVGAECGRLLMPSDEREHSQTVVLSYRYWSRSFGQDCQAVGRSLSIKGVPFTIVGVSAKRFIGLSGNPTDLWVPLQTRPDFNAWGSQDSNYYASPNWWCILVAARLAPGVTKTQAEAEAAPGFQHAAYESLGGKPRPGEKPTGLHLVEARGLGLYRDAYKTPLGMLLAMVVVVLLIACGNVSLLLAARNTARRREFSIRLALGGSRGRLLRLLLAESLLLMASGSVLGWLFALVATRALGAWADIQASLAPDARVLLFTVVISLLAGLVFGLAPLFGIAKVSVGESLKTSAATAFQDTSKKRLGKITAALQVALCLVLLVGTALMVRTLRNLETVDLGMKTTGLLVFGVSPRLQANSDQLTIGFYRTLLDKLRSLPEVKAVSLVQNCPGTEWSNNTGAVLDGKSPNQGQFAPMRWNAVGPQFFSTTGIPLISGRDINEADGPKSAKVALVNSTFVRKYLEGRPALGHSVSFTQKISFTVVGVVADSKYTEIREEARPMAYFPYEQLEGIGSMHVELRTYGDPKRLLPRIQNVLVGFAPDLAPLQPMTQKDQFDQSISGDKLIARLAMFFGLLAVILAATGLYGTIAYSVSRRTSELGIRMALGAEQSRILRMILREGLLICALGILIGLPFALAGARLLRSLLYGLKPADPLSILAAAAGILTVTALACLIPAVRAASISPTVALRNE